MKLWLTGMLCLLAMQGHAQDATSASAERELLGMERVLKLQAFQSRDLKTVDDMLDDSFVLIDSEGKYFSKTDLLALVKSVDLLQFVSEGMAVRLHGNTAVVTGLYQIKTVSHGKPSFARGRFVDTWMRENGKWKSISSIDVPSE